jgi:hypothetical protein
MSLKVKVHGNKTEPKKEIPLKLLDDDFGVVLAVVDKNGHPVKGGCLLTISNSGILKRTPTMDKNLGFRLNKKGQILEKFVK